MRSSVAAPTAQRKTEAGPETTPHRAAHPLSKSGATAFTLIPLALFAVGILWSAASPSGYYVLLGGTACVIVSLPMMLQRPYDIISPWSLVALAVYIGSGIRPIFIALGRDGSRTLDDLFLLGHQPEFFLEPGGLYLLGLGLLTVGYLLAGRRHQRSPIGHRYAFNNYVTLVILVAAFVGFAGFALYAASSGGLSLSRISAKRSTIEGLDVGAQYSSNGQYRLINSLSAIAFWAQLAHYSARGLRHGPFTPRGIFLVALFVNATLLPLYASTRADIVYLVIVALSIKLFLSSQKTARRLILSGLVFVLMVTPVLTALRTQSAGTSSGNESRTDLLLDTFIYSRTFTDIPTSALIIDAVPERLAAANGSTITAWLAAPVPRRFWPEKPLISAGPTIGVTVFGNVRSGVPPGLVAEAYWNFGMVGLLLLPLLFGMLLRAAHTWAVPIGRRSPATALIFSACVLRLGIDATTNSLGFALFSAVQTLTLLVAFLLVAGSFSGHAKNRA